MILRKYGISISLLKEKDIEMVRQWRNDPVVVASHEFREYITPEMQKAWFKSVNNINNLYTIIGYQGEKVGVINLKNIDWAKKSFETGVFIPFTKYHLSPLPAIVSFITTEIPFTLFDWNIGYAHVLKNNIKTRAFIRQLGYELTPGQEDVDNQEFIITQETFAKKAAKLKKAISSLVTEDLQASMLFEKEEMDNPVEMQWEEIVKSNRNVTRMESTAEGRIYYFP